MDTNKFELLIRTKDKQAILDFIKNNKEFHPFTNQILVLGNYHTDVNLNMLTDWFIYKSQQTSPQNVVSKFKCFLSQDDIDGFEIVAIVGLIINSPIELNNGIKLIPFDLLPDSTTKAMYNPQSIKDPVFIQHCRFLNNLGVPPVLDQANTPFKPPSAALLIPSKSSPKFTNRNSNHLKYFNSKQEDLLNLCQILTLIGPCAPSPVATWWEPDENVPYSRIFGGGAGGYISDVINHTSYQLELNEEAELIKICNNYMKLSTDIKSKLKIPLERLNRSIRRNDLIDKFIELGIGMEAVFLDDNLSKELSYRLFLRAARFLEAEIESREKIKKNIKLFYDRRSKAVHTGNISEKTLVENKDIIDFIIMYLCKAIKTIIDNQKWPKWNEIELS